MLGHQPSRTETIVSTHGVAETETPSAWWCCSPAAARGQRQGVQHSEFRTMEYSEFRTMHSIFMWVSHMCIFVLDYKKLIGASPMDITSVNDRNTNLD
jgi:hypothetical protein